MRYKFSHRSALLVRIESVIDKEIEMLLYPHYGMIKNQMGSVALECFPEFAVVDHTLSLMSKAKAPRQHKSEEKRVRSKVAGTVSSMNFVEDKI